MRQPQFVGSTKLTKLVKQNNYILTLSPARILKESITCSAVSVSAVSRVMKSKNAWKLTWPVLFGSTIDIKRSNSWSPWKRQKQDGITINTANQQRPPHKRNTHNNTNRDFKKYSGIQNLTTPRHILPTEYPQYCEAVVKRQSNRKLRTPLTLTNNASFVLLVLFFCCTVLF